MNNLAVKLDSGAAVGHFNDSQLRLLKRTIAKDTNDDEFNLFVEICRNTRLDPFRRQIMCMVFNKDNPAKRQMAIVTGIDGMRRIAQRARNYRPASEPPSYQIDADLKDTLNPHGIIACNVTVHCQDNKGEWYPVMGEAYWDEFAPVEDVWAYNDQAGGRRPTGEQKLKENWRRMPRLMIAKCAEAQALRRGWPDDLSAIYEEAEFERQQTTELASEKLADFEREKRQAAIGGPSLMFAIDPGEGLQSWPHGQIADKLAEYIETVSLAAKLQWFLETNRDALRQFWSINATDALAMKEKAEARLAHLQAEEGPDAE